MLFDDVAFGHPTVLPLEPETLSSADGGEIIVTGERIHRFTIDDYGTGGGGFGGSWSNFGYDGGGGGTAPPPAVPDDQAIDIRIQIDRPLTPEELQAVADLQDSIMKVNAAVLALADDALLTLPNGAHVTGAQMKAAWKNADFVIVENGVDVGNDSNRGSANPNYGDPIITFNIGTVDSYNNSTGGTNFLVAHELGHLSQAAIFQGTATSTWYSDERTADDVARALLNGAQLPYLSNPIPGYTPDAPTSFSVPSGTGSGGDTGGGGGGGGGGGWTDPEPI